MVRFGRILLMAAILGAAVIAGAQVALATPKPDVVLINQPASSVCVRKTFTVGVWYQQFSGGSRAYRVDVYDPRGTRVLYKHGNAPSSAWKFWKVARSWRASTEPFT